MKKLILLLWLCLPIACLSIMAQKIIKGKASYYADKFHGRRTASGELYNKDSMTCAHLKYPFGTVSLKSETISVTSAKDLPPSGFMLNIPQTTCLPNLALSDTIIFSFCRL